MSGDLASDPIEPDAKGRFWLEAPGEVWLASNAAPAVGLPVRDKPVTLALQWRDGQGRRNTRFVAEFYDQAASPEFAWRAAQHVARALAEAARYKALAAQALDLLRWAAEDAPDLPSEHDRARVWCERSDALLASPDGQVALAELEELRISAKGADELGDKAAALRVTDRLPLCPDHRDKFHGREECQACRAERAENALRASEESDARARDDLAFRCAELDRLDARLARTERERDAAVRRALTATATPDDAENQAKGRS